MGWAVDPYRLPAPNPNPCAFCEWIILTSFLKFSQAMIMCLFWLLQQWITCPRLPGAQLLASALKKREKLKDFFASAPRECSHTQSKYFWDEYLEKSAFGYIGGVTAPGTQILSIQLQNLKSNYSPWAEPSTHIDFLPLTLTPVPFVSE